MKEIFHQPESLQNQSPSQGINRHRKIYQLLLEQQPLSQKSLSSKKSPRNIFELLHHNSIGRKQPNSSEDTSKHLHSSPIDINRNPIISQKSQLEANLKKQLPPVSKDKTRVLSELNKPRIKDRGLRIHSSLSPAQEILKEHKIYEVKNLKLANSSPKKFLESIDPQSKSRSIESQRNSYEDRSAILGEISFRKPLIEQVGDRYFEMLVRNRWKQELKLPKFIYQLRKNEPFSDSKSIRVLKKNYPQLRDRKGLVLKGRVATQV